MPLQSRVRSSLISGLRPVDSRSPSRAGSTRSSALQRNELEHSAKDRAAERERRQQADTPKGFPVHLRFRFERLAAPYQVNMAFSFQRPDPRRRPAQPFPLPRSRGAAART
ncbi:hypothetical protein ebB197 [Aromatoleum aromaticum EbN1]|uniref:Uncharacterized protein n=1 Tax=Aromatoleum aromaticum (strain DSM 19018 / LMG 30748 / EbN1) TaxID=76114 RepID=Q5P068_AROAE|nr:hypothetical protein ebB197 [Aromatoleum aromaticum EbN1]